MSADDVFASYALHDEIYPDVEALLASTDMAGDCGLTPWESLDEQTPFPTPPVTRGDTTSPSVATDSGGRVSRPGSTTPSTGTQNTPLYRAPAEIVDMYYRDVSDVNKLRTFLTYLEARYNEDRVTIGQIGLWLSAYGRKAPDISLMLINMVKQYLVTTDLRLCAENLLYFMIASPLSTLSDLFSHTELCDSSCLPDDMNCVVQNMKATLLDPPDSHRRCNQSTWKNIWRSIDVLPASNYYFCNVIRQPNQRATEEYCVANETGIPVISLHMQKWKAARFFLRVASEAQQRGKCDVEIFGPSATGNFGFHPGVIVVSTALRSVDKSSLSLAMVDLLRKATLKIRSGLAVTLISGGETVSSLSARGYTTLFAFAVQQPSGVMLISFPILLVNHSPPRQASTAVGTRRRRSVDFDTALHSATGTIMEVYCEVYSERRRLAEGLERTNAKGRRLAEERAVSIDRYTRVEEELDMVLHRVYAELPAVVRRDVTCISRRCASLPTAWDGWWQVRWHKEATEYIGTDIKRYVVHSIVSASQRLIAEMVEHGKNQFVATTEANFEDAFRALPSRLRMYEATLAGFAERIGDAIKDATAETIAFLGRLVSLIDRDFKESLGNHLQRCVEAVIDVEIASAQKLVQGVQINYLNDVRAKMAHDLEENAHAQREVAEEQRALTQRFAHQYGLFAESWMNDQ